MCRYSDAKYKTSYVCFHCRVSFQQRRDFDYNGKHRCPQCMRATMDMGRDFKAPRKRDKKAWARLPRRVRAFDSCGCAGGRWRDDMRRKRRRVWRMCG